MRKLLSVCKPVIDTVLSLIGIVLKVIDLFK